MGTINIMPQAKDTIKVKPIPGEALRYQVESWQASKYPHVVDLMENNGNGSCDCKDFLTRCEPNYKEERKIVEYGFPGNPNPKRTRCKHIHVAVKKFANDTLKEISKQQRRRQT